MKPILYSGLISVTTTMIILFLILPWSEPVASFIAAPVALIGYISFVNGFKAGYNEFVVTGMAVLYFFALSMLFINAKYKLLIKFGVCFFVFILLGCIEISYRGAVETKIGKELEAIFGGTKS